ncbi:MAG: PhoU domain-containing protein [Thermoproteota archaeon]
MLAKNESIENKYVISSVLIARYLERIADHASYACESIIYVATGKNAKVNIC